jgi:hypothetical protein
VQAIAGFINGRIGTHLGSPQQLHRVPVAPAGPLQDTRELGEGTAPLWGYNGTRWDWLFFIRRRPD